MKPQESVYKDHAENREFESRLAFYKDELSIFENQLEHCTDNGLYLIEPPQNMAFGPSFLSLIAKWCVCHRFPNRCKIQIRCCPCTIICQFFHAHKNDQNGTILMYENLGKKNACQPFYRNPI